MASTVGTRSSKRLNGQLAGSSESLEKAPKLRRVATEPTKSAPKAATPKAAPKSATKAATPKAATPKAATPKAATPKAATPKAATPKAGESATKTKTTPNSRRIVKASSSAKRHRDSKTPPPDAAGDTSDDAATPMSGARGENMRGVLTPSAVVGNKFFPAFSSENTLQMHTSSKSLSNMMSNKTQKKTVVGGDTPSGYHSAVGSLAGGAGRRSSDIHGVVSALDLTDAGASATSSHLPSRPLVALSGPSADAAPPQPRSPRLTAGKAAAAPGDAQAEAAEAPVFNARLAFAVSFAYASFIFCRSFFSVTQAAMKADTAVMLTDKQADAIITSTAVAFGLAKFPAGILVNSVSPKNALLAFMALTSSVVFVYGSAWCDTYDKMFLIAMVNAIPQAGAYPAATKLVCAGFAPEHHSSVFAFISIGSRVGQVLVAVVLGEVLRRTNDWRLAVQFASVVVIGCAGLVVLLTAGGKETIPPPPGGGGASPRVLPSASSSGAVSGTAGGGSLSPRKKAAKGTDPLLKRLARLGCNPRFWLVNVASAMLLISKGFDTYAVRYITDLCNAAHPAECLGSPTGCVCRAYAPQVTAGVSLGIVISLLFGSWVYERLKSSVGLRAVFIVALCALNFAVATAFFLFTKSVFGADATAASGVAAAAALAAGNDPSAGAAAGADPTTATLVKLGTMLFLLGFSAGYPFYVPQSLFAVGFGSSDAATVVGCGECVQSVAMAAFIVTAQRYAIRDNGSTDWVIILRFIMMAACSAFVLMGSFMLMTFRNAKTQGALAKAKTA